MYDIKDSSRLITLPLYFIHELLTGDSPPRLLGIKPRSRAPGIYEELLIIRWELGALIAQLDPQETLFHIELYPSQADVTVGHAPSHAEIYTKQVWDGSAARRHKLKAPRTPSADSSNERHVCAAKIVRRLRERGWELKMAANLAEAISQCHLVALDNGTVNNTLALAKSAGVDDILLELEESIKAYHVHHRESTEACAVAGDAGLQPDDQPVPQWDI